MDQDRKADPSQSERAARDKWIDDRVGEDRTVGEVLETRACVNKVNVAPLVQSMMKYSVPNEIQAMVSINASQAINVIRLRV